MNKREISFPERIICIVLILGLLAVIFGLLIKPMFSVFGNEFARIGFARSDFKYQLPEGIRFIVAWQSFPEGRIYEKIDGRATLFKEYGVERLDFASVQYGKDEFDIYIYVMRSVDGALGVYLAEQPEGGKQISLGTIAEKTRTVIRVCKGNIYLNVIAVRENPDIRKGIKIAKALCESFETQKRNKLNILSVLPVKGMLRSSLSLNKEETFGLQSLSNTISADYEYEGFEFTYFVKKLNDNDESGIILMQKIYDELKEFGAEHLKITDNNDFIECDLFGRRLLIRLHRRYLIGIYGRMRGRRARRILTEFINENQRAK